MKKSIIYLVVAALIATIVLAGVGYVTIPKQLDVTSEEKQGDLTVRTFADTTIGGECENSDWIYLKVPKNADVQSVSFTLTN